MYHDAGIWAACFLGKRDPTNQISHNLIELLEDGKKRAIVPCLPIVEMARTIHKRIVQFQNSDAANMTSAAKSPLGRYLTAP